MPLYSNTLRYLPHIESGDILRMGLKPQTRGDWIETDADIRRFHRHKLDLRNTLGNTVSLATEASRLAREELASLLVDYLLREHPDVYRCRGDVMHCIPGGFSTALTSDEPLWNSSLWVADDLMLMEEIDGQYRLTAASLCSPSHWSLAEKFGRPIREIHDPIPGFHQRLSPRIDRFFEHLKPGPHFERFNWSLQAGDTLAQFPGSPATATTSSADAALFYRVERQTLKRLPETGAIVFTIRVYLHPLEALETMDGALPALIEAVDATPEPLARYKGFHLLQAALARYR